MPGTATKAEIGDVEICVYPDEAPDVSYLYQDGLGFEERRAQYEAGGFNFVGVTLRAELRMTPDGIRSWIETPGLWGIEDDSGDDYFRTVAEDEAGTLRDMLDSLGLTLELGDVNELSIVYP